MANGGPTGEADPPKDPKQASFVAAWADIQKSDVTWLAKLPSTNSLSHGMLTPSAVELAFFPFIMKRDVKQRTSSNL